MSGRANPGGQVRPLGETLRALADAVDPDVVMEVPLRLSLAEGERALKLRAIQELREAAGRIRALAVEADPEADPGRHVLTLMN